MGDIAFDLNTFRYGIGTDKAVERMRIGPACATAWKVKKKMLTCSSESAGGEDSNIKPVSTGYPPMAHR